MDGCVIGMRVIITAGGAGIGRATAERFADAGAVVWICDVDTEALADTCAHPRIDGMVADVSNTASMDDFMSLGIQRTGGLDVLVNNA